MIRSTSGSGIGVRDPASYRKYPLPVFWPKCPASHSASSMTACSAARFADQPADIEPGQIHHRERPHRQAKFDERRLDLLRQRAFEQ